MSGPRLRTRRARRRAARHHAGLPRRRAALHPRAQAVRQADRRVRAGAGQARRHVCRDECLPGLRLFGRQGLRPRPDHARGRRRRDPLRRRERHPHRARRDPASRRLRLRQRLSDRAFPARRQALRDRRRHQRNPPHADRARTVQQRRDHEPFVLPSAIDPKSPDFARNADGHASARSRNCGQARAGRRAAAPTRRRRDTRARQAPGARAHRAAARSRHAVPGAVGARGPRHVRRRRAVGEHRHRHRPRQRARLRDRRQRRHRQGRHLLSR